MNPSNKSSSTFNRNSKTDTYIMNKFTCEFYIDTLIRPDMIDLSNATSLSLQADRVLCLITPTTPTSVPPPPPPTPASPYLVRTQASRIVTFRIPSSESSISFSVVSSKPIREISMTKLDEVNEQSE
jgi:hypothetical protein